MVAALAWDVESWIGRVDSNEWIVLIKLHLFLLLI
jgi:hypothetical protein